MTTTTAKAVNYTPEQEETLRSLYEADTSVEAIATAVGKSMRSVVAKLSAMKLYKAPAKAGVSKNGEPVTSKEQYVEQLANIMGCSSEELAGLEKANKTTLSRLVKYCAAC